MYSHADDSRTPPELVPVGPTELPVFRRLFEYYLYDFSEILGTNVGPHGEFVREEKWRGELARQNTKRWLVRVGDAWAGLAILASESYLDGRAGVHDVDEFFVMRAFRRRGVGRQVATQLFRLHAGQWEVRVLAENSSAASFWRAVIDGFSGGRFAETLHDSQRWKGPVFSFVSSGGTTGHS